MRPYFERRPGAAPLPYVATVSWPRSGHHLLMCLVAAYFGPRFGYCEYHVPKDDPAMPCCGRFPCERRDLISMSKNHDFDLSAPIPTNCPLIVQWREPIASIQSEFELAIRGGGPDTAEAFAKFAERRAGEYRRFMAKWLEAPIANRLEVEYDELVADPRSILSEVLALWGETTPEPDRLNFAIATVPHVSVSGRKVHLREGAGVRAERHVDAFRYHDADLFERIREVALGKAVAPFRRSRAMQGAGAAEAGPQRAAAPASPPAAEAERRPLHRFHYGERLVFHKIPECGGPELTALLAGNFPAGEVFAHVNDVLPRLPPEDLTRYRLFAGYFTKHGVDAVPGPKRVVTVLRDPCERILALYRRWRSIRAEVVEQRNLKGPRLARALSLKDFLKCEETEVLSSINNHLVRVMLGPLRIHESQGFRLEDREYAAETALTNLRRYNFVAFHDTLEADIAAMLPILELSRPQFHVADPLDTVSSDPANLEAVEEPALDDETWDHLNRLTFLDRLFYKRAHDLRHTLRNPYPS